MQRPQSRVDQNTTYGPTLDRVRPLKNFSLGAIQIIRHTLGGVRDSAPNVTWGVGQTLELNKS